MKFCPIAPIFDLDLVEEFDTHLLLAWMCNDEVYRKFYRNLRKKKPNDFIILDNGANEKVPIVNELLDQYLNHAVEINAKEVQAPDVQFNYSETLKLTKNFLKTSYKRCKNQNLQIMGIPQGNSYKSFTQCWEWMLHNSEIDTLGLGYRNVLAAVQEEINVWSAADWIDLGIRDAELLMDFCEPETFKYTMSRLFFLKRKVNILDLAEHKKQLHLLGLWNPVELKYYKRIFSEEEQKLIRSCDSAASFQAAQVYVKFDCDFGVSSKPREYLDLKTTLGKKQRQLAEENIELLKHWL